MLDQADPEMDLRALVEESEDFTVDTRVYTSPAIFDAEMRRIFLRTWVYVGHESEIPNPGDFRTSAVGRVPVIVTRDQTGAFHVLVNTCRHRGTVVCREERGNARFFQCPYHNWLYRNDGRLVQIPDSSGYPEGWAGRIGGLLEAPRIAVLYGMIFANFSQAGPSFDEYLGPLRRYVEYWFGHSPTGRVQVLAPFRASYPGNWKLQVENSTDGWHARYVHESALRTMHHFGTRSPAVGWPGATRAFPSGHGVLERPRDDLPPEVQPQFESFRSLLAETYGAEHAEAMFVRRQITLFPSFHLMEFKFRVIQPVAVDQTVIYEFPVRLEGVPDDVNAAILHRITREISISSGGPVSSFVNADDVEAFARVQSGLADSPVERIYFSRGLHREVIAPDGERTGESSDELPQRSIYREWRRLMHE
ncbi:MAG: Rieske 2Fe-2S domain-containing protein [Chloroflexi bacterium]|nr:Rieske 2Fe-2S domain-containing protein [Chloroflexota bacterium]